MIPPGDALNSAGTDHTPRNGRKSVLPRQWFQSFYFLFRLVVPYTDAIFRTSRLRVHKSPQLEQLFQERRPIIFCQWHGRLTAVVGASKRHAKLAEFWPPNAPISALVSTDAAILANAFGVPSISILPGAVGAGDMKQVIAAVRGGTSLNVSLDGPLGPYRNAAPGIIRIAQMTGAPLVPVGFSASPKVILRTWDRFLVPAPFGTLAFHCGEPLFVPRNADAETLEHARVEIERRLTEVTEDADKMAEQR